MTARLELPGDVAVDLRHPTSLEATPEAMHELHLAAQTEAMRAARVAVGSLAAALDEIGCPECDLDVLTITRTTVRCRPCNWTPALSPLRLRALASLLLERIEERR